MNVQLGSKYTSEYYNKFFSWRFHFKVNEFLIFFFFFSTIKFSFQILPEVNEYLESSRTSTMEFFHKNLFLQDSRGNTCAGVRQVFILRSSHSEVSCEKGVLKICSKFRGKRPCRSVVSIKLLGNFIEITRCHGCSLVNLLHVFRTLVP